MGKHCQAWGTKYGHEKKCDWYIIFQGTDFKGRYAWIKANASAAKVTEVLTMDRELWCDPVQAGMWVPIDEDRKIAQRMIKILDSLAPESYSSRSDSE